VYTIDQAIDTFKSVHESLLITTSSQLISNTSNTLVTVALVSTKDGDVERKKFSPYVCFHVGLLIMKFSIVSNCQESPQALSSCFLYSIVYSY